MLKLKISKQDLAQEQQLKRSADNKVRITFYLNQQEAEQLIQLSMAGDISISHLVRQHIKFLLQPLQQ